MERVDIAIIGTGPAGVSAAITAKVRNKSVLLIGSRELSEKMSKAHQILNYPGLPEVSGADLVAGYKKQLAGLGIEVTEKRVNAVYAMGDYFGIQASGEILEASTVILAAGIVMGKPFPGENELLGSGVSYCATCDAQLVPGLATEENHVKVNLQMETNLPGLFACGDIAGKPYQYIKAAGQGNVAALSAAEYLDKKKREI